ncbi:hypothetical protein HDZ31DRAFT_41544 [Schizophyllum fasciatum]
MRAIEEALQDARTVANLRLHRATYVPTDQDATIIQSKASELRALEHKIAADISALLRKQDAIRSQIAIHDAIVAPWRRLPFEVLSDIFISALPDDWEDAYAGRRTLNFARVCWSWRQVALLTPRLWTSLRIDATKNPPSKLVKPLRAELERTAQAPLSLFVAMHVDPLVFLPFPSPTKDALWGRETWALLGAQSHRWERALLFELPSYAYDALAGNAFPALQDLAIYIDEEEDEIAHEIVPLHVFENAPNLASLFLNYTSPIRACQIPQSWSLTKLIIECGEHSDVTLVPCLSAIMACNKTLRSLTISADESFGDLPASREPTTFPRLEELELRHNAILLGLLLSTPNLQTLRFSAYSDVEAYPFEVLKSILERSSDCVSIRSLRLEGLEPNRAEDVVDCLCLLPRLTELELKNDDALEDLEQPLITLPLMIALTRDPERPSSMSLLPNLSHLVIDFGAMGDIAYDPVMRSSLSTLLHSRRDAQTVDGVDLAALQRLRTSDKFTSWPPEAEHNGDGDEYEEDDSDELDAFRNDDEEVRAIDELYPPDYLGIGF